MVEVRHSPIHGYGVFALRRIRKGTTVMEYLGERVTHAQADARYEDKDPNDNHTFLFTVDARTVIDGGVNGNDARYINHGCDPNCESTSAARRIFIEAIRTIQPGEELAYDYQIQRDAEDEPNVDEIFACRCGAAACRGTMLAPHEKRRSGGSARKSKARAPGGAGRNGTARGRAKNGRIVNARPAKGRPAKGRPAKGRPAEGRPAKGRPAQGRPAQGRPAEGRLAKGRVARGRAADGGRRRPSRTAARGS
jgi:hypothetical protein